MIKQEQENNYTLSNFLMVITYTVFQKQNVTTLSHNNSDIHELILIICGTNVTEKVSNHKVLYFPTSPNYCFCTTWGNRKPGNCVFSLKCCMLFAKNMKHIINITLSQLNHPKLSKWLTLCTRQDLGQEHSTLQYVILTLDIYQVYCGVGRRVKMGVVLIKHRNES